MNTKNAMHDLAKRLASDLNDLNHDAHDWVLGGAAGSLILEALEEARRIQEVQEEPNILIARCDTCRRAARSSEREMRCGAISLDKFAGNQRCQGTIVMVAATKS